jgi:hypothetical protein
MDIAKIIERYGVYYHTIGKLSEFPLTRTVTIEELSVPRALIQRAYKEMKREKFDGNLIDYFCYLSTQYVIIGVKETLKGKLVKNVEEKDRLISQISAVLTLEANRHNVINLLRLYRKNPFYFQEAFIAHLEEDEYREVKSRLLMSAMIDYAWTELAMKQHSDIVIKGLVENEINDLLLKEYIDSVIGEVIEETSDESVVVGSQ